MQKASAGIVNLVEHDKETYQVSLSCSTSKGVLSPGLKPRVSHLQDRNATKESLWNINGSNLVS